jgi:hypothetical protein
MNDAIVIVGLAISVAIATGIVYVVANDFETIGAGGITGSQALGIGAATTLVPFVAAWALFG